ncbi:hypothetical protein EVAR_20410_1 [Eumeta japonica]|uniref:Uncharacterized protein n=1 Tax=Eumeta variegata TaxID=151549 RepID=A0A4C1TXV3_EUMVA|nr:hypothetical protein EVAR_20410_1 [Eumeta japonica]
MYETLLKASQCRNIETRRVRRKGRGAPNLRIVSFVGNSERQSFVRCTAHTRTLEEFEDLEDLDSTTLTISLLSKPTYISMTIERKVKDKWKVRPPVTRRGAPALAPDKSSNIMFFSPYSGSDKLLIIIPSGY